MTRIVKEEYFDGSKEKIERLGLASLIEEIKSAITSFTLEIKKEIHANGSATLRELIDNALRDVGDWTNTASGDVDWIKCRVADGVRVCVGVEVSDVGAERFDLPRHCPFPKTNERRADRRLR